MTKRSIATGALLAAASVITTQAAGAAATRPDEPVYDEVVARVLDLPYDPTYVPTGVDSAFDGDDYPSAFPLTDTSTGTCCTSVTLDQPALADLAPPFAEFPDPFELVELASFDGTPLHAFVSITPGAPGVVVMHGFNSNGKHSVVRYAAFLVANGYSVIAPDHRDLGREWDRGGSWNPDGTRHGQTLGWKESEDLLAAAAYLDDRGVHRIGVLGFSEGAQNTMLALGIDHDGLIDAALTFSGPADQATQLARNEAGSAVLLTTVVGEPDVCAYLDRVGHGEEFRASPNFMLGQASAVTMLDGELGSGAADVPSLHLYAQDDLLVPDWHATILASRTNTMALHDTVLIRSGNHAYFTDRWWTQRAALEWFDTWLDTTDVVTTEPTVARPVAGIPLREQTIPLDAVTRADGDAELRDHHLCPGAAEPIGPTALLDVDQDGATVRLDGRRSYSGWDDHRVVRWSLDAGDRSTPSGGRDLLAATRAITYQTPGTYTVTLEVTDDTGRTATATEEVVVGAATADDGLPHGDAVDDAAAAPAGELPATGAALAPAALLAVAALLLRRRHG